MNITPMKVRNESNLSFDAAPEPSILGVDASQRQENEERYPDADDDPSLQFIQFEDIDQTRKYTEKRVTEYRRSRYRSNDGRDKSESGGSDFQGATRVGLMNSKQA